MKTSGTIEGVAFSKQLESARKDVECFFGILKSSFRFLKSSVLYREKIFIVNVFSTCCVSTSILDAWDGLAELKPRTDRAGADGVPEG